MAGVIKHGRILEVLMKIIWNIALYLPFGLAFLFAFVSLLEGVKLFKVVLSIWVILIGSHFFLTFVLPLTLAQINRRFFREFLRSFPEPTIVVAMVFFGWAYATVIALCTFGIVWVLRKGFRRLPDKRA